MREGEVQVALSVLYSFWDEIDVTHGPSRAAVTCTRSRSQLSTVEDRSASATAAKRWWSTTTRELAAARRGGRLALVHCVEGGFHLGPDPRRGHGRRRGGSPRAASPTSRSRT